MPLFSQGCPQHQGQSIVADPVSTFCGYGQGIERLISLYFMPLLSLSLNIWDSSGLNWTRRISP